VQTALIEKLHRRFKEEGTVINYPMRTLEFPEGWGLETLGRVNGDGQAGRRTGRNGRRRGRGRRPPPELHVPQEPAQDVEPGGGDAGPA